MKVRESVKAVLVLFVGQLFAMAVLAVFATYDTVMPTDAISAYSYPRQYSCMTFEYMMDIMMMMVIGIGYYGTILNYFGYGSMGFTLLISSVSLQFCIMYEMILDPKWQITFRNVARAAAMAFSPLVAMGSSLGRMSFLQLVVHLYIELFTMAGVKYICTNLLKCVDAGGALHVHVYGSLFGLMASRLVGSNVQMKPGQTRAPRKLPADQMTYDSEVHSLFGAMFIWAFFPSFHAAQAISPLMQFRCFLNTVLSLAGAAVGGLISFGMFYSGRKMIVYGVMSACIAGGVVISAIASLNVQLGPSAVIGTANSFIVAWMHRKLLPELMEVDTMRSRIVYLVPGIISAFLPIPFIFTADKKDYYSDFDVTFPEMQSGGAIMQAVFQVVSIAVTLLAALLFGTMTGKLLSKAKWFHKFGDSEDVFKDRNFFLMPKTVH